MGNYLFVIHYLYYKVKIIINLTQTFFYITNYLICSYSNFLVNIFLDYDSCIYFTLPRLATKKRKLLRTNLYNSYLLKSLSLFFNLSLFILQLAIFEYLIIFQYLTIFRNLILLKCIAIFK